MDKKYTVKDFYKKYNSAEADKTKEVLIKNVMNAHYVPYENKITICEKIVENSYYKTIEKNGANIKKLHINSPAQYMLYCLWLVEQYTNIKVDFKNGLEEFNLLNKSELLDIIISNIPERELKEFRMILDMIENDVMQNEYEIHAFISNQVESFGELFGVLVKPAIEQFNEVVKNMDEKTIDKIVNKLNGANSIKSKFNFMK